jgi:hypothetical protein
MSTKLRREQSLFFPSFSGAEKHTKSIGGKQEGSFVIACNCDVFTVD